jgi:RNA polymerase sigma factor (sigma-70 family)
VVRQLESLFEGGSAAGLADRQLLERYIASRDEAAFAAIVARHGPMVLGVCRQLLGDAQLAEDAFQATYLVLARKARSIRDPELLGNWLYGVASRTARCARQQLARRRREEGHAMSGPGARSMAPAEPTAPPADRPAIDREQAEALHGEVDRLPRAFRLPVVLCYFEGLTLDEAARRLRCPPGTLRSRLARAREKLRTGLVRRGVILPAAALGPLLAPRSVSASVPPLLCETTTRAAIAFAARHAAAGGAISAPIAALAQEVLYTMFVHKLRLVVRTVLALASVATGAGYLALASAGSREGEPPGEPRAQTAPREGEPPGEPKVQAARTEPRPPDAPRPLEGRMFINGRVLGPDGKPVRGAIVDVVAKPRVPFTGALVDLEPWTLLGRGKSDGDGHFNLEAPRTASTRMYEVLALAAAPGAGLGWIELNPDADRRPGEAAAIKLLPEQPIRIRLVDVTGAPAKGAEIGVMTIGRPSNLGKLDGIALWANPPEGMRTWPGPVKTDDQGRATIPGIGSGLVVLLVVRDLRYAQQHIHVENRPAAAGKETTHALPPAKIIEGRVLAADTGEPIPNAVIAVDASPDELGWRFNTRFRADDRGRYTANPSVGEYFRVYAYAPEGRPYLVPEVAFAWTKGAVKKAMDIRVPRGVAIRGKVTEAGMDRPLAGASIQFIPGGVSGNDSVLSGWQAMSASREDGSFQVVVPPGKGHLLVFGPTPEYVAREIGANTLYVGRPGGMRYRAHAIIPYEVKAGEPPREVAAVLRRGATIRGRVEGPDGQTIAEAFIITTLHVEPTNPFWRSLGEIKVRDGRFELHGLDPEGSARISILDANHEWGASFDISGRQAGEDLTIRLQPCGKAKARFVGPDGKPIAKHMPTFALVATPGPTVNSRNAKDQAELSADEEMVANIDRKHYWNYPLTDADGRIALVDLIPGALYRIIDFSAIRQGTSSPVRKDFSVKPGETLDLGDIVIEKPEGR